MSTKARVCQISQTEAAASAFLWNILRQCDSQESHLAIVFWPEAVLSVLSTVKSALGLSLAEETKRVQNLLAYEVDNG